MVRDRDLTMTFAVPPEPVVVLGDAIQLERVLLNLLSNALKFTPDGGRVTTTLDDPGRRGVAHVADTGIGIPERGAGRAVPEVLPRLHRPGPRHPGHRPRAVDRGGIVAVHGGRIGVESAPGEGTTSPSGCRCRGLAGAGQPRSHSG